MVASVPLTSKTCIRCLSLTGRRSPATLNLTSYTNPIRTLHQQPSLQKKLTMPQKSLPGVFMRGGTSNGLVLHRHHLPQEISSWQPILSAIMGSPDEYGRQLNGMGSGISSTSKVCVVEKSSRPGVDLDYTFVQVGIEDGKIDLAGNCGNMSSAVGPFAYAEGLLRCDGEGKREGEVSVRIFNTNTNKLIISRFNVTREGEYDPYGEYSIDGVPGTGSRITLEFVDPAGAKTGKGALPTENAVDVLKLEDGSSIEASLCDIANPGVFIRAEDLGVEGNIKLAALEDQPAVMERLEEIRREGARMMGLDPETQTIPKIAILSRPKDGEEGVNVVVRALSMRQPHKAVPLTLALNLGTAVRMEGTLPAQVAVGAEGKQSVTVAHPTGKLEVGGVFEDGKIKNALLHRTARVLMKGDVFYSVKPE